MSEVTNKIVFVCKVLFVVAVIVILASTGVYIKKLQNELNKYKNAPADTIKIETHDTIKIDSPVPVYKYIKEKEYVYISDTLTIHDTINKVITLPRTYAVYKDSTYRAVVSGVEPRLDSMAVFQKVITQTITKTIEVKKPTRWGLGVQIGGGIVKDKVRPYLGVGVSYNIFTW